MMMSSASSQKLSNDSVIVPVKALRNALLVKADRDAKFKNLKDLSAQLNAIATELVNSVKENTSQDFNSYSKMQYEIDKVQKRIVQIYEEMQENKKKNL